MPSRMPLSQALDALERMGAVPAGPPCRTPFEHVLYEIASYLVPDERRLDVHRRLEREIGLTPDDILRAPRARLVAAISDGGMKPAMRADRVREAAGIARDVGDLGRAARAPLEEAIRTFARFPAIGRPGAEKILLFAADRAVPALESNGLRVLERLGFASRGLAYAAAYRAVRGTLSASGDQEASYWRRAHLLLRRHGQEVCRRSSPACDACPLAARCPTAGSRA